MPKSDFTEVKYQLERELEQAGALVHLTAKGHLRFQGEGYRELDVQVSLRLEGQAESYGVPMRFLWTPKKEWLLSGVPGQPSFQAFSFGPNRMRQLGEKKGEVVFLGPQDLDPEWLIQEYFPAFRSHLFNDTPSHEGAQEGDFMSMKNVAGDLRIIINYVKTGEARDVGAYSPQEEIVFLDGETLLRP